MAFTPIVYPSSLPGPQTAPIQSAERRNVSPLDGARTTAVGQRDRLATQQVAFVFSFAQAAIFRAWYRDDLIDGGAWFASNWPLPQGGIGVRQFIGAPRWVEYLPTYGWRVTALFTVSGRCELPTVADPIGPSDTLALFNFGSDPLLDETDYSHDLTTSGGVVSDGAIAFSGNGDSSYALGGPYATLALPSAGFTVQGYVTLPDSQPQRFPTIFELTNADGVSNTLFLRFDREGHEGQWELNTSSGGGQFVYSTGSWPAGKYHFCVMPTGNRVGLWIGGELVTTIVDAADYSAGNLCILLGSQLDGSGNPSLSSGCACSISSFKISPTRLFADSFTPPAEPLLLD